MRLDLDSFGWWFLSYPVVGASFTFATVSLGGYKLIFINEGVSYFSSGCKLAIRPEQRIFAALPTIQLVNKPDLKRNAESHRGYAGRAFENIIILGASITVCSLKSFSYLTRVSNFAKAKRHFKCNTRPYLRLPSCRATKTASDSIKKSMQKRQNFFYGGLKL